MTTKDQKVDGAKIAAEILNRMPAAQKERLLQAIQVNSPSAAQNIEKNLWKFDDIKELTPQSVQNLMRETPEQDVILALKQASPDIKEALLSALSERRRQEILDALAALPPVPLRQVEEAQRRILLKLDYLRTSGKARAQSTKDVWI